MATERSRTSASETPNAPMSDSKTGTADRARSPQGSEPPWANAGSRRARTSSSDATPHRGDLNSIRPRRARERMSRDDLPVSAASPPKRERDSQAHSKGAPTDATPASAPAAALSPPTDSWALPQSVRDRFIEDKRRFYFPDGAPAFRDHGERLTTRSENTEVIRSLIDIARTRGWEEITAKGTQRFRQEAWRQGRLAGLQVRGYRPTVPERAALIRALARQAQSPQMDLGVTDETDDRFGAAAAGIKESEAARAGSTRPAAHGPRDLIVGKLIDHGRDSYRFDPHESMSYFVEIDTPQGKRTFWGKDFERAMKHSLTQPKIGDDIAMRRTGADPVTVQRRELGADGRVIAEHEVGAARSRWRVEKRDFFEERRAAAEVLRDARVDRLRGSRQHPELAGTYLWLEAAKLTARRHPDPEVRRQFVAVVRGALADSIARGDPLKPVRLRDRAGRVPERKAREREPGPARA